jgi:hypothetical protein
VSAKLERGQDSGRYYLVLGAIFLALLGVLGGASRADELQQFLVRMAAIAVIAGALWPLNGSAFRVTPAPAIFIGFVYLVLALQLIPLPPSLWGRMPAHDLYVSVAQQTGAIAWRPWTISPDLTLNSMAALLPATAIGIVALTLDFHGRVIFARVVIAIACASALLGLVQFAAGGTSLHLFRTTSDDSAVGVFANRNHEAVLMACGLPIVSSLASIRSHQQGWSIRHLALAIFAILLMAMALAATGSRMGLFLGAVGSVAAALIYSMTARPTPRTERNIRRLWGAGAVVAVAAVPMVSLMVIRSGAIGRLMSDPIDPTRTAALGPMLQAARAFMPFGAGFGTFDPVYRRFEPDALLSTIYLNRAHNEPAQLAIEGGVPALALLLVFLGWWLRSAARAFRSNQSAARRALGMAMVATTLILMLSSLVDYPLRTPLLSGLFAIACVELVRSNQRINARHSS